MADTDFCRLCDAELILSRDFGSKSNGRWLCQSCVDYFHHATDDAELREMKLTDLVAQRYLDSRYKKLEKQAELDRQKLSKLRS